MALVSTFYMFTLTIWGVRHVLTVAKSNDNTYDNRKGQNVILLQLSTVPESQYIFSNDTLLFRRFFINAFQPRDFLK
jgi:hypothetical protein